MRVVDLIGNKNRKSAWFILFRDNSWYTIQRTYWQKIREKSKKSPVKNSLNARSNQNDDFCLKKHVQLLHDGNNHWFLSFFSNGRVQIYESLQSTLTQTSKKSIQVLYRNFSGHKM